MNREKKNPACKEFSAQWQEGFRGAHRTPEKALAGCAGAGLHTSGPSRGRRIIRSGLCLGHTGRAHPKQEHRRKVDRKKDGEGREGERSRGEERKEERKTQERRVEKNGKGAGEDKRHKF